MFRRYGKTCSNEKPPVRTGVKKLGRSLLIIIIIIIQKSVTCSKKFWKMKPSRKNVDFVILNNLEKNVPKDLTVPVDQRLKLKESEKLLKYLGLTRGLKAKQKKKDNPHPKQKQKQKHPSPTNQPTNKQNRMRDMKVTVTPIIVCAFGKRKSKKAKRETSIWTLLES